MPIKVFANDKGSLVHPAVVSGLFHGTAKRGKRAVPPLFFFPVFYSIGKKERIEKRVVDIVRIKTVDFKKRSHGFFTELAPGRRKNDFGVRSLKEAFKFS